MHALASVFLAACLLGATSAWAQRPNQPRDGRGQDGGKVEVTPEKLEAIYHTMLGLSILEGDRVGPIVGGGNGVVVCDDCGPWPGDVPDCAAKRQAVHDAAKANADAQKLLDMFQSLLEAYYEWQFWSGVGGMVTDMVAAATSVATAGTATGAVYAAAQVLAKMGSDAAVGAMQDAVAEAFGIDLSGETAMQDAVSMFNEERKKTNDAYQAALADWLKCRGEREKAMALVDQWNACWAARRCWIE